MSMFASPWASWAVIAFAMVGVILGRVGGPVFSGGGGGGAWGGGGGALPAQAALHGVARGTDVYLFLTGMMLLAELARQQGLFDWLAAHAVRTAAGSARRLFTLVFGVGTLVTVFLSNDATAVVLTPAVAAAARAARADRPLPYLFVCAFVANAASFVLPISNPANLVLYGDRMPRLLEWLPRYGLASALAILATYAALRWACRDGLGQSILREIAVPSLSAAGRLAAVGIALTAMVLLAASAFGLQLGLPTCAAGLVTAILVLSRARTGVGALVRHVSWGVLPLVAGLFVFVEALETTGVMRMLGGVLEAASGRSAALATWASAVVLGIGCNLVNNLPAGLVSARMILLAHVPDHVRRAVLIGVDLGPNLSVTGSLATILWLAALRREGQTVSAWAFLKLGALVMPPALLVGVAGSLVFD